MGEDLDHDSVTSRIRSTSLVVKSYDIYISGAIESPECYIDEIHLLRNAEPDSVIYIRLNTGGGNTLTAIQLIRAIKESQALVVGCIEGYCMSAGTLIFLACDDFMIADHSVMMCHNYTGGSYGKGHELFSQAVFDKKWSDRLIMDVYNEFLTPKEIQLVIDGTDIYLSGKEVEERCTKLILYRQELQEIEQQVKNESQES